jgi:hypothetical protein
MSRPNEDRPAILLTHSRPRAILVRARRSPVAARWAAAVESADAIFTPAR